MANEGDEYEVPSAARRKEVELSRGVVLLPPERMKKIEEEAKEEEKEQAQKKEEEKQAQAKAPVKEEKKTITTISRPSSGAGLGPSLSNILALIAILLALAAIGFSYLTLNSYNQMRSELKGVILDLQDFKSSSFPINAQLTAEHVVNEEISLRDVLSSASFPVSTTLHVTGSLSAYNPATRQMEEAPYEGNISVSGSIDINPLQLDPSRKMHLNYTIPGNGSMTLTIPVERIWTTGLDDVLSRLEKIAG